MIVTQELLSRLFRFDLENGKIFWREPPKQHPRLLGQEAGCPHTTHTGKSYWHVKIGGKAIKRSHIIFRVVFGYWPKPCVDHKDGDSLNDCPSNLRQATVLQNNWNHQKRKRSVKLPMGVRALPSGKFQARVGYLGSQIALGAFDTAEEAQNAHRQKREALYGQFA